MKHFIMKLFFQHYHTYLMLKLNSVLDINRIKRQHNQACITTIYCFAYI